MSISQIESKIKSLQSEIARLNKAYTDEAKKECGYLTSASGTQKSITKNTSPSMLKTKLKSISSDSEKAEKSRKKQAELQEKAAKKKTELAKQQALLQKEQDKVFQKMTKRQNEALNNQRKLVEETEKMQEEIGTKEYDFFISHAWEDKETVAKPGLYCLTVSFDTLCQTGRITFLPSSCFAKRPFNSFPVQNFLK